MGRCSAPRPIATSRTEAMSMPKRLPAEATNATCTATVTRPKPPGASVRPRRIWTPNAAATPTRSPATFAAVPTSSVRSSLTPGEATVPPLLEVSEAAEALFDLALFFLGEGADRLRRQRLGPSPGPDWSPTASRIWFAKSPREISGPSPGLDARPGHDVDALRPVIAREPVRGLDHAARVREAVERRRLEQEVRRAVEVRRPRAPPPCGERLRWGSRPSPGLRTRAAPVRPRRGLARSRPALTVPCGSRPTRFSETPSPVETTLV